MAKKPSYGAAVLWLIANERLDWMDSAKPVFPDTVLMIAELFDVPPLQILRDIRATLNTAHPPKKK
jgi:hypothetical protein